MKGISVSCMRRYIIIFNLIMALCALILIILGVVIYHKALPNYPSELPNYVASPISLMAAGTFGFIVAFIGCCGAVKEIRWMLILYGVLVIILEVRQVAAIVITYIRRGDTEKFMKAYIRRNLRYQPNDFMSVWNPIQTRWKCCGIDGPFDYKTDTVPVSCCKPGAKDCPASDAHQTGCFGYLIDFTTKLFIIHCVIYAVALVGYIAATVACFCLASAIKKRRANREEAPTPDVVESSDAHHSATKRQEYSSASQQQREEASKGLEEDSDESQKSKNRK